MNNDSSSFIWTCNPQPSKLSDYVFNVLKDESRNADRVKSSYHAAAIVYKKRILSIGLNRRKTHPLMTKYNSRSGQIFLHSEVDAIIKTINLYGQDILKECSLYVLRTTKSGKIGYSKPCSSCQQHIDFYGIKKVFWS